MGTRTNLCSLKTKETRPVNFKLYLITFQSQLAIFSTSKHPVIAIRIYLNSQQCQVEQDRETKS